VLHFLANVVTSFTFLIKIQNVFVFSFDQECHVTAYPPPSIKWYRNMGDSSVLISNNQHFKLVWIGHSSMSGWLTLTINKKISQSLAKANANMFDDRK
jgi:hypothetical protein